MKFFDAELISFVTGETAKTVHRHAKKDRWPMRRSGRKFLFQPPVNIAPKCSEFERWIESARKHYGNDPATVRISNSPINAPLRSGLPASGARLGELRRAAIVSEVFALATTRPKLGLTALINTVLLAHLGDPGVSKRSIWRWVSAFARGGLAALADHKAGRSGRKPEGKS